MEVESMAAAAGRGGHEMVVVVWMRSSAFFGHSIHGIDLSMGIGITSLKENRLERKGKHSSRKEETEMDRQIRYEFLPTLIVSEVVGHVLLCGPHEVHTHTHTRKREKYSVGID